MKRFNTFTPELANTMFDHSQAGLLTKSLFLLLWGGVSGSKAEWLPITLWTRIDNIIRGFGWLSS